MAITVVNKYKEKNHIYIGRGSIFGNPWPITESESRDVVCDKYEQYFYKKLGDPKFKSEVDSLVLKASKHQVNLGCFCKPARCHGDTIKHYIDKRISTMHRICIAGSRDFNDFELLEKVMLQWGKENQDKYKAEDIVIVSGTARGADRIGERFARKYDLLIEQYPANWDLYGKSAGYKRNMEMAEVSDLIIIFWDSVSPGTKHMINICYQMNKPIMVIEYTKAPWS